MILCQQCTRINSYNREVCYACGAKLMVVTRTTAATAYGGPEALLRPTAEEHLLERITLVESALLRANEQIEMLVELLQRQATTSLYDNALLNSLVEHLSQRGGIDGTELEGLWRKRLAEHHRQTAEQQGLEHRIERMLCDFSGENFDLFARLLDTGADLILEGNLKRGIRYFEKALVLDPANAALAFFIGEHFFRFNKPVLSRAYLERAVDIQSNNHTAMLMLGVICGDEGDIELAKRHLTRALKIKKNLFTAHYGLGRILVSEGKLREAIAHLKRALALKPTPEMYYLVGRAYLEDGRADVAVRHLRRCVELDPRFDAALYHLGLIYLNRGNPSLAQQHFRAAHEINPRESRYRVALRARKANGLAPLPVFGRTAISSRKVLTSGDVRLSELVRSDLLSAQGAGHDRKGHKRS